MNETVRVALVGYGYWGSKHARVLSGLPGVELHVVEQNPRLRMRAATDHRVAGIAADLETVLGGVDAVVVAAPPRSHHPIGLMALEAGLPCLIEKPLATSTQEAEELIRAADAASTVLMVGHTFEYNAAVWAMRDVMESGDLGAIRYLDGARLSLGRYQSDCNVIWDLAPHDISIVTYLLDEMPSEVEVWSQRNLEGHFDDVAYLRLAFPRFGVTAQIHVSWHDPEKVRRLTVGGERKFAVYNDAAERRVRVYDSGVDRTPGHGVDGFIYRAGEVVVPEIDFVEPLLVQDSHFVECVRRGERPHTDGRRGLDIVRVLEASDRAIQTGRAAAVSESTLPDAPARAPVALQGAV